MHLTRVDAKVVFVTMSDRNFDVSRRNPLLSNTRQLFMRKITCWSQSIISFNWWMWHGDTYFFNPWLLSFQMQFNPSRRKSWWRRKCKIWSDEEERAELGDQWKEVAVTGSASTLPLFSCIVGVLPVMAVIWRWPLIFECFHDDGCSERRAYLQLVIFSPL